MIEEVQYYERGISAVRLTVLTLRDTLGNLQMSQWEYNDERIRTSNLLALFLVAQIEHTTSIGLRKMLRHSKVCQISNGHFAI